MTPDNFLIVLFYALSIVGATLIACMTSWSSGAITARLGRAIVLGIVALVLIEISSLIALRVNYGYWIYRVSSNPNAWLFEQHPNMVAFMLGNKRYSVQEEGRTHIISHNSLGFRGAEFKPKGTEKRIVIIGGSTTYGVDVSDTATWPTLLGNSLGPSFEVLNLGVAGHGTAEHLYMMGSVASRLEPDVVVLHVGLNDMHCMHSPDITPLVNKCHSDLVFLSTGQCFVSKLPRLATVHAFVSTMQNLGLAPRCPTLAEGKRDLSTVDERVLEDFKARTGAIIAAALGMRAQVIVVPQVGFQERVLGQGAYQWWTPYIRQSSLPSFMKRFNEELKGVAAHFHVPYVDTVDRFVWSDDLFVDASHLNERGNQQLADLVASSVRGLVPRSAPSR